MISSVKRTLTVALVATFLASCSQGTEWVDPSKVTFDPTPTSADTSAAKPSVPPPAAGTWKPAQGPGQFTCLDVNSRVSYGFSLPTPATHPSITQLEELRTEAGIEKKPTYVVVRIDATGHPQEPGLTNNPTDFTVQRLTWRGQGGKPSAASDIHVLLSSWVRQLGPEDPTALKIRRAAETLNMPVEGGNTGEQLLATTAPITALSQPMLVLRTQQSVACSIPRG